MTTKFVQVTMDIDIEAVKEQPRYRVFVDNELFTERTWIWQDQFLREMLQIEAPPGRYPIRVELVDPESGVLKLRNMRMLLGPGNIHKNVLEIE